MDKTIDIMEWFYNNNLVIKTNTYDGIYKLNMLVYLSKKMFSILDNNIIQKDFSFKSNKPISKFIFDKYNSLSDLNTENLTDYEKHVLKIINREYGYLNFDCMDIDEEDMIQLYGAYKDEKLDEKNEMINGKYFFIDKNVSLTEEEYFELENISGNNSTYYVYKDDDGKLMVY